MVVKQAVLPYSFFNEMQDKLYTSILFCRSVPTIVLLGWEYISLGVYQQNSIVYKKLTRFATMNFIKLVWILNFK